MNNKVLALVGMCGAGKSVVNDYFVDKGFTSVYFGGVTMDELKKRGMEINEANEKAMREGLRKEHGMGAFALLTIPKIEKGLEAGHVVADGLYSWTEYKILKERFGDDLVMIAVQTPPLLRYERLSKRPHRPLSREDAQKRDYAEIENIEKGGPIAMADITLLNEGNPESLMERLKALPY